MSPRSTRTTVLGVVSVCVAAAALLSVRSEPADEAESAATRPEPRTGASIATRTGAADPFVFETDAPSRRTAAPSSSAAAYLPRQVMVTLAPDADLQQVAAEHGLRLLRPVGRSGLALVELPERFDAGDLKRDSRISVAAPNGIIRGAAKGGGGQQGGGRGDRNTDSTDSASRANPLQWHLDAVHAPAAGARDLSGVVVAVLDSGVAYTDHSHGSHVHAAAPSLAGSAIHAPADFIDGDALPLDEHQHGTHIASIIASSGEVEGVAPGVGLMPVRVLDADNAGDEQALIEGIYHAIDNGADVINMSLSFGLGYTPSEPLRMALQAAHDAGVVMVAASGNDGAGRATWPAASPLVLSVGAFMHANDQDHATDYGNTWTGNELVAAGGAIELDENLDGYADGVLAETIAPGDPSRIEQWFYSGTSQAAAQVSGAVAHLLAAGAAPDEISPVLQSSATFWTGSTFMQGVGAGGLNVDEALAALPGVTTGTAYHASVLPYLKQQDGGVQPRALVTVVDANGQVPTRGLTVYGTVYTSGGHNTFKCKLQEGQCGITGGASTSLDANADASSAAWAFSVDAVVDDQTSVAYRPGTLMFATDALEITLAAIEAKPNLKQSLLGFHWQPGDDPDLGAVASAYSILNAGTGLASSPLGLLVAPQALGEDSLQTVELDLDGTGLASSPLGLMEARLIQFGGVGLASSPLGLTSLELLTIDGTGLASSPLGLRALDVVTPTNSAFDSDTLALSGSAVSMTDGVALSGELGNTHLQAHLDSGGWITQHGYESAQLLATSDSIPVGMGVIDAPTVPASLGGERLEP
jgi:hypothetical protein